MSIIRSGIVVLAGVLALAPCVQAATTNFVIGTRGVFTRTGSPDDNSDFDENHFEGAGFADLSTSSASDPTPAASGDEVSSIIRQRSTITDNSIDLEGAFDFDAGPDAALTGFDSPLALATSGVSAVFDVTGGDVILSLNMFGTAIGAPSEFRFRIMQQADTLLDVSGDQQLERLLAPGQYNLLFDFVETTDVRGMDQDGGHELHVAFTDADNGGNPIPLPPAVFSALAPLASIAGARLMRRRGRI